MRNCLLRNIILKTHLRKCSKPPTLGKISIENQSKEIIRVSIIPAISWNYHEQRTTDTLLRNRDHASGGNHIL